jgi:L-ascorbate metabolism protein UlaG (beta-lactamase superfamily)
MPNVWESWKPDQYLGLLPWTWVQMESAEAPGPFPFLGGVDPAVVASLQEAHQLLLSSVETAISDVFAHRASLDDPQRGRLLEDAYAELVRSRPHLSTHIKCGRDQDGVFQWDFPRDQRKSATVSYAGLRVFNAVNRQAVPFPFTRPIAPVIGKLLGLLDGSRTVSDIRSAVEATGPTSAALGQFVELLKTTNCLTATGNYSVRKLWLDATRDQDVVHLGHAALMYRHGENFLLFDPWLLPWLAESPVPSLWTSLIPRPSAIFLTHDHDDHVDPRTLLMMPKDIPIVVPSRRDAGVLYYDYPSLLREFGFARIIELAHGEAFPIEGGSVASVPFYGEDPVDLEIARNCYLVNDRGRNTLIHVDSGPTNAGKSVIKEGVIQDLVNRYGSVATLFASQQQLKEIRTYAAYACLSHPGRWLEVGENGYLTNSYLAELAAAAKARLFASYATGGADWYPDHLSFMFSRRNPARTALLTAHWDRPESLKDLLAPIGCGYHYSQALDIFRARADGGTDVVSVADKLSPMQLYRVDHGDPPFMRATRRP